MASLTPALGFQPCTLETDSKHLPVTGTIPSWLEGQLVRSSAVAFERGAWHAEHWFDGLAMLAGFRIAGGVIAFHNRFLASREFAAAQAGHAPYGGAFRTVNRSILQRLGHPLPPSTDNANISVAAVGPHLVALGETEHQFDVDPETLVTLGRHRYDDTLPRDMSLIAHPVIDPARRVMVGLGIRYAAGEIVVYEIANGSNTRRCAASWRTKRLPYVHSFALTGSKALIIDHPFRAPRAKMALDLILARQAFFTCFQWENGTPTRLIVLDRNDGESWTVETDPLFFFHTVNAWDEPDGTVVVDLMAIDHAPNLAELRFDRLREEGPQEWPVLRRLRLRRGHPVVAETIGNARFDFPMIDPRLSTVMHRYVWGVGAAPATPHLFASALFKLDTHTGACRVLAPGTLFFSEPIFVPRPGAFEEDDGALLTVALDDATRRSALLVLDGASLEERARGALPFALPFGFHGRFFASG